MTDLTGAAERLRARSLEKMTVAADLAVERTKAEASRRTGALVDSIHHTDPRFTTPDRITCEIVADAPHARYQDEGTGIYGPTGEKIKPRRAGGVLVFDWPAAGGVVFARSVSGSPGRHFFKEPMPDRWHAACADVWAAA